MDVRSQGSFCPLNQYPCSKVVQIGKLLYLRSGKNAVNNALAFSTIIPTYKSSVKREFLGEILSVVCPFLKRI